MKEVIIFDSRCDVSDMKIRIHKSGDLKKEHAACPDSSGSLETSRECCLHTRARRGKQGITLSLTDEAKKSLAMSGFTPKYGARPLQGVIRNQLRRPLSRMIISGEIGKGATVKIELDKDGEVKWSH